MTIWLGVLFGDGMNDVVGMNDCAPIRMNGLPTLTLFDVARTGSFSKVTISIASLLSTSVSAAASLCGASVYSTSSFSSDFGC